MAKISGLLWNNGKAYFFSGDHYVRYDVMADAVDDGYPRPITDGWPGLFSADIDAAVLGAGGEFAYFFRGSEYIKWDVTTDRAVDGYPKPIAGNWPGLFTEDIDAAVLWSDQQTAYFFRGAEYIKYDMASDLVADGYPKPITGNWPGLFDSDIDAALLWATGTNAYFFKGDVYVKYDVAADATVEGYPRAIADGWRGLPFAAGTVRPSSGSETPIPVETPGGKRIEDKSEPAAGDIVTVVGHGDAKVSLHHLAAKFWGLLVDAARADGIADPNLLPVSGYRSIAKQEALWQQALAKYGSEAEARKWVAKPGGSAHHSGRAIDCWLGSGPNSENVAKQRTTDAWKWLVANAERFGFYPYDKEPWHWEYNPPQP